MDASLAGVPIIATDIPALRRQLTDTDVIWSEPTTDSIANAILEAKNVQTTMNHNKKEFKNNIKDTSAMILSVYKKLTDGR